MNMHNGHLKTLAEEQRSRLAAKWWLFVGVGVLAMLLGVVSVAAPLVATLTTATVLGYLLFRLLSVVERSLHSHFLKHHFARGAATRDAPLSGLDRWRRDIVSQPRRKGTLCRPLVTHSVNNVFSSCLSQIFLSQTIQSVVWHR